MSGDHGTAVNEWVTRDELTRCGRWTRRGERCRRRLDRRGCCPVHDPYGGA